jgi:hypothetical protein
MDSREPLAPRVQDVVQFVQDFIQRRVANLQSDYRASNVAACVRAAIQFNSSSRGTLTALPIRTFGNVPFKINLYASAREIPSKIATSGGLSKSRSTPTSR